MISEETILQVRDILVAEAKHPRRVILFGSAARGTAGDESDLDLLVVEQTVSRRHAEMVRLRNALRPVGLSVDLVVISEKEARDWARAEGSTLHAALNNGRVLFAA